MNKMSSLVLLVIGVMLIVWGVTAMDSFGSDVSRFFSGAPTDKSVWMLIAGELDRCGGAVGRDLWISRYEVLRRSTRRKNNEGARIKRINQVNRLGVVAAVAFCVVAITGCNDKSQPGRAMEKTGAALSTAADKTVDAAKATGTATKDVAGRVGEKTGETLEKAGAAVEEAGQKMQ